MQKEEQRFIRAASTGDIEKVRSGLNSGIHPNVKDKYGFPALVHACRRGQLAVVKLLINSGADIEFNDDRKRTPFFHAVGLMRYDVVKYLAEIKCDINSIDMYGWTALDFAITNHNVKMAELLRELGAKTNWKKENL